MAMSIFDAFKSYKSDWKEVAVRAFTKEEAAQVVDGIATVESSKFGQSLCFTMVATGEKKYLPIEPSCTTEIGTKVPLDSVSMVKLHYEGTRTDIKNPNIMRARFSVTSNEEITNFDDPFGLNS